MSYQVIASFQGGLDARKFFLSLPPGTLTKLFNGHITQGGEIEKRKVFFQLPLPNGTFGEQETTAGIVVFGSTTYLPFTGSETLVTGTGSAAVIELVVGSAGTWTPMPGDPITVAGSVNPGVNGNFIVLTYGAGILTYSAPGATAPTLLDATTVTPYFAPPAIYQQLAHPLPGVTMTGAVSSTYFEGQPQIITTWSNGDVLVFDGTTVETDFYVGSQCKITPSAFDVAKSLVTQATGTGRYTGVNPVLPAALYIQITSGTNNPGVNVVGTTGMAYRFNRPVTLNVSGGGTQTSTSFALFASPVDWATSNAATATAVMTAINANLFGFVASIGIYPAGSPSNAISVQLPATDAFGNPLTVTGQDALLVIPGGNVQLFNPPNQALFDILSVPSITSANPYVVSKTTTGGANLTYQLLSAGVPATLPANAAGQFTIVAGTPNAVGTGTLTISSTGPVNNDTVTIAGVVYTFVTFLTSAINQVLIGASIDATLGNLVSAINGTAGAGSTYSAGTSVSTNVAAGPVTTHATLITAIANGTPGNLAVSKSSANLAWSGLSGGATGTLNGGTDTNQLTQISVGATNLLPSVVPFNQNQNQTAADVVAKINGYQGTSGFNATNNNNVVTITAVNGGSAVNEALVSVTCAAGFCVAGCSFYVTGGAGQTMTTITSSAVLAGGGVITNGTVTWATTDGAFVIAIAANIIAKGLYCAVGTTIAGVSLVYISPIVSTNLDGAPVITVNGTAGFSKTPLGGALSATANNPVVYFYRSAGQSFLWSVGIPNSVVVTPIGGVPPYTYSWAYYIGSTEFQVYPSSSASGTSTMSWRVPAGQGAQWVCTVTDSLPQQVKVFVNLSS